MQNPNIKEMSVVELKALAFDILVTVEQQQKNLQIVNQEIQSRGQVKEEVTVEPEPTA